MKGPRDVLSGWPDDSGKSVPVSAGPLSWFPCLGDHPVLRVFVGPRPRHGLVATRGPPRCGPSTLPPSSSSGDGFMSSAAGSRHSRGRSNLASRPSPAERAGMTVAMAGASRASPPRQRAPRLVRRAVLLGRRCPVGRPAPARRGLVPCLCAAGGSLYWTTVREEEPPIDVANGLGVSSSHELPSGTHGNACGCWHRLLRGRASLGGLCSGRACRRRIRRLARKIGRVGSPSVEGLSDQPTTASVLPAASAA